jgi:ribose transport system ATP-binding protein
LVVAVNLTGKIIKDVSISIDPGEIVGLTGLVGSGASEIGRILAGVDSAVGGNLTINGTSVLANGQRRKGVSGKVAYLPADRLAESGIPSLTMQDNIVLPRLREYWGHKKLLKLDVKVVLDLFDVNPKKPDAFFGILSGGNQQKVLLGKWLLTNPTLLILDDPTVGIDPGTREVIFDVLRSLAKQSVAILLISSEPDQLAKICNRVLIVRSGTISTELSGEQVTEEEVALASAI